MRLLTALAHRIAGKLRVSGMPELHLLTPLLGVLQDKGFRVALVTDGRMSGVACWHDCVTVIWCGSTPPLAH